MPPTTAERRTEAPRPARRESRQGLRNMELGFLLFAYAIVLAAMLQVQFGVTGAFDTQVITLVGGVMALTLATHVVLRFLAPRADPFLLPIATAINGIGIGMIYRLDLAADLKGAMSSSTAQIIYTGIAIAIGIAVLVLLRNHRILQRYTYLFGAAALLLLLLPLIPGLGVTTAAARVWISIGPFNFQPGEIAKILLAIFFAGYLVTARDSLSMVSRRFLGMRSDFIIAALGEELGLAGLFALLSLYFILVARGLRIGHSGGDDFGRLLATGLSFVLAIQVFIVVGGVTRVIPLTGLTTPFLAAGGSSLVANWIIIAILLRLSDTVRAADGVAPARPEGSRA